MELSINTKSLKNWLNFMQDEINDAPVEVKTEKADSGLITKEKVKIKQKDE